MRVPTNTAANVVIDQLRRLSGHQALLQNQVSTGQRIFGPGDDPAAVGRVLANEMEQRAIHQYRRNADTALELSTATFGGLKELKKISDRVGELVTLGSGATSEDAMRAYAAEVNQLLEQAVTLGNTRFRNDYIFAGTAVDTRPVNVTRDATTNEITGVAYAGNTDQISIPVGEGATLAPGSDGATNQGIIDFINGLVQLRDALGSGNATAVAATRSSFDAGEDLFVASLSQHGAIQLRIEVSQTQQQARLDELERLVSVDADADLPSTVVKLSQTATAYEAALASASDILQMSLMDYLR
jgi:flagellar hook-associated protein 3 FlgL